MKMKLFALSLFLFGVHSLSATDLISNPSVLAPMQQEGEHINPEAAIPLTPEQQKQAVKKDLIDSSLAAETWLNLVDAGKYADSWNSMALTTKILMKGKEWETYLQAVRKPFGKNIRRTLVDQRIANDPPGVPKGEYMVIFYDSSFSNKVSAKELMILQQANNGSWHVFSYVLK